jgi:hypothetical protein
VRAIIPIDAGHNLAAASIVKQPLAMREYQICRGLTPQDAVALDQQHIGPIASSSDSRCHTGRAAPDHQHIRFPGDRNPPFWLSQPSILDLHLSALLVWDIENRSFVSLGLTRPSAHR